MKLGDKIYYTGDMANLSGWFVVSNMRAPDCGDLQEIDGDRTMLGVYTRHVGTEYHGHCNPHYVTEAAYNTYRAAASAAN
jgi:hypothetical protein